MSPNDGEPDRFTESYGRLTVKQRAFLVAYLGPCAENATAAAQAAGYRHPHSQGSRLTHHPLIAALIRAEWNRSIAEWRRRHDEEERERHARLEAERLAERAAQSRRRRAGRWGR